MKRIRRSRIAHLLSALLATISLACLIGAAGLVASTAAPAAAAGTAGGFTGSRTITRTHLIDGTDDVADTRSFSVRADVTQNLRDRQGINISWHGAHPSGGIYYDPNSQNAPYEEYPVVILQCRGVDSASVPVAQRISQQTCFTQTPDLRYQPPFRGPFPPYRLDRFEPPRNRTETVGAPSTIPTACPQAGFGAQRWVPFDAADGTRYYGGSFGCAGLAPEQSIVASPLNPSNATFAASDKQGNGNARFIIEDAEDNASLGCSAGVACSVVVIPIMGISCDAAAMSLPAEDRPRNVTTARKECTQTGFYQPGEPASDQSSPDPNSETSVNGLLWWSASNWRNRISIPITLAETAAGCDVIGGGAPTNIYGSEYMLQATQQWAPTFCRDRRLFRLQYTQTSEVQAKNLLATGVTNGQYLGVKAAFQGAPPDPAFTNPIVQAPTAVTGFAIGYLMDDGAHREFTHLRLDARLLAKLLTMSYPAYPTVQDDWKKNTADAEYRAASNNPLDMGVDPEFLALNPGMKQPYINQLEASSTLFAMSSDSDVMTALTSYINADPEARAWLDGKPDPWGMVVNPHYTKIALPVASWPQLDTYYNSLGNDCIADGHVPVLPLIAGPVSDPAQITFNMQYGIANSQVNCVVTGQTNSADSRRLTGLGRQQPGIRFLLGIVSLADARRYQINTAALQTQNTATSTGAFTDATGRSFVEPTTTSLRAAAQLLKPDDALGTWPVDYDRLRTDRAGVAAYPGVMLMSTDVPTAGLDKPDATNYAKFLDYIASAGQVPGTSNGQLAAGYLPITAADGLGGLHSYTVAAADAVRQQRGFVPKASAPIIQLAPTSPSSTPSSAEPSTTTRTGSPGHSGSARNSGGGGSAGGLNPGASGVGPGPVPAGSPSSSGVTRPTAHATAANTSPLPQATSAAAAQAPITTTADTKPGWSAVALPVLVMIALVSGLLAAWTSGVGRR